MIYTVREVPRRRHLATKRPLNAPLAIILWYDFVRLTFSCNVVISIFKLLSLSLSLLSVNFSINGQRFKTTAEYRILIARPIKLNSSKTFYNVRY